MLLASNITASVVFVALWLVLLFREKLIFKKIVFTNFQHAK